MTSIGTFWEGIIVILLGIAIAIIGKETALNFDSYVPVIIGIGIGYIGGGVAGKSGPA